MPSFLPADSKRAFLRPPFLPAFPPAAWIFLLAFGVRLLVLIRGIDSSYFLAADGDMKFYSDWALRIADGHWTDHKAFYGLPGYAYLLGGLFFFIGFDPFAVGFLQAISEGLIAALIFELGCLAVPDAKGKAAGTLAALGWVFFQPAQAFAMVLMPTTWLVLAYWGLVWWSLRVQSKSLWRPWLWMGMIVGGVATLIATILFVLPFPACAAARSLRKPGAVLAALASLAAGVFVGASPCWVHNYFIAEEPVFLSAHSGVNFWIGNNPEANGYPKMPPGLRSSQEGMLKDSIRVVETAAGHPLTRSEVSRYWSAKASAYIHEHPGKWLKLMLVKVRNSWNAFQYDDLSIITGLREEGVLTPGIRFGFVAILAIPGLLLGAFRHPRARWIAAAVLLHMAALLPVFVTERYRLAAVPGLLLLGGIGLADFGQALLLKQHGWPGWLKEVAAYLAIGGAAAWFVTLPPRDKTILALDDYNTGIKALALGRLDTAQQKLERAHALVPANNELTFVLGNLWLKKGDIPRAKQFYWQALHIDPKTVGALDNLAFLAITEHDAPLAEKLLLAALHADPGNAKAHYLLAYAQYSAGNREAAAREIQHALLLRPAQPQFQELQNAILTGGPIQPLLVD